MKPRVAVLFGGPSVEHEVSVLSARGVLENIDREAFFPLPVYQDRQGSWYGMETARQVLEGGKAAGRGEGLESVLKKAKAQAAFPLIHGTFGEDGTLQGALEALRIPYVGCGVKASAVGMDKEICKQIWRHDGLPIVPYETVHAEEPPDTWPRVKRSLALPVFVKPADSGSSVGITKVRQWHDLKSALEKAFKVTRKVLVEKGIEGREIEVSVLGGYQPDYVSPPGEVVPGREFYDYEDKYLSNQAQLKIPAQMPPGLQNKFRELAARAFTTIDGYGMARVDFFLEGRDRIYINEINSIPGFTSISMYPKLLGLQGIPYSQVITRLIDLAFKRGAAKFDLYLK
jgi:D-alanine-D-alanine ligase